MSAVMVITALRCGTDADGLFAQAPGLAPNQLVAAYDRLERERAQSAGAWDELRQDPTVGRVAELKPTFAKLLPVPTARLTLAVADAPDLCSWLVGGLTERIEELHTAVDLLYDRIAEAADNGRPDEAIEVGRELFDPTSGHYLFAGTHYLPRRVGELSPLRITDLLSERRDDPKLL